MLQSASRSIQCPLGSFKLSSKCYAQQPSQCGKGTGTLGDSQRTGLPGRVPFSARTQPYAGHSQWLHFNPLALQSLGIKTLQDFLAQRTRDECIRANGDHEGRAQYGRELWNEKLGPVAECEYPRDQDHIGTVPFEKIPSIFVAVAAVSILVLCPAPAHALFHTDPTILYASPLTRSQRYAQLHKYKDSAPEPGKPSNEGQREHLPTNIDARSLEQKSQAQPGAAFRASVETCSNAVGQYVEEKFSAARIVVRKGLSKLDLTGVLVGVASGFTMGAIAVRAFQSPSSKTDIKATDTVPPPAPPKFLEGSGSADVMLATADSLSDSGRALSRLDISRQHQEESTVDFDPSSESSPENGESIYDFDTGDTPDYATDYNAEMAAGRAHDDVTIIGLPTASRILPEWKLDSGAVNIVLENRTSRPIVLFADEARPGAKDSIRTAWKVVEFEGRSRPKLLQLHPSKTQVGARRVEGGNLVLRSGPFAAKLKSTWAMLQPTLNHTAWMREATTNDEFFGMASEGQITVLNLRTPQWPPYDFELFVEGDLCAVHKGTERGRAYRFQAPNVVTLGVPRQGMRIRKGSAFDSEVELEERRVNLDLTMLKQGDQLCWLTLGTNEELDLFWQSELVKIDIEPARV